MNQNPFPTPESQSESDLFSGDILEDFDLSELDALLAEEPISTKEVPVAAPAEPAPETPKADKVKKVKKEKKG